jgi:hypothetical protein
MANYTAILIPYVGRPHIVEDDWEGNKNKLFKLIDETGDGFEFCRNDEYLKIGIHPLFKSSHKRWLIVDLLLRRFVNDYENVSIFSPDIFWKYQPNPSVVECNVAEKTGRLIHGQVLIKVKKSALRKICKNYEDELSKSGYCGEEE